MLVANDGERGLELAFTEHPHLVLLDVMMPGMDGYRVCRELQFGYTKDIPVIFLTAKAEVANMMEANRSGASAYITKPFRVDHLLQTVRDVLRDASVYYDEITGLPTLANVQVDVQRMLFDHSQLGIIYVTLDGIHALEQLQGFEIVDEVFRVVGQRLVGSRGQLIRGDDFVSISSLGNAFLIVLVGAARPRHRERRRPARRQTAARGAAPHRPRAGAARSGCWRRSACTWATRTSRSRPRCASSGRCSRPSTRRCAASSWSGTSRGAGCGSSSTASSPTSRSPASTSPS